VRLERRILYEYGAYIDIKVLGNLFVAISTLIHCRTSLAAGSFFIGCLRYLVDSLPDGI
jgi:hypothetical protein